MAMMHAGDRLCEYALGGAEFVATCLEPLHRPEPQSVLHCVFVGAVFQTLKYNKRVHPANSPCIAEPRGETSLSGISKPAMNCGCACERGGGSWTAAFSWPGREREEESSAEGIGAGTGLELPSAEPL